MKKKLFILLLCFLMSFNFVLAIDDSEINENRKIQNHISDIGLKILNANKINKRIIFVYEKNESKINKEPALTKRQVVAYKNSINYTADDNEIAAMLSGEICKAAESYSGPWRGFVSSAQIKFAPKKYEIFFDKKSVDLLVNAGYNPVALITYLNKFGSQKRYEKISNHNLISKRLANIYEYIYFQYPSFLANNEYLYNESYQNFLLTSSDNRRKLEEKIKNGLRGKVKYE